MAERADKGPRQGPGELSPLSGSYLLLIIGEPASVEHKELILQRITKGFLSWDREATGCNLDSELQLVVDQAPVGEEAKSGERLIQYVTENMVTEVLINAQVNTLQQCMKNLLSSYTRHKHIIHAGYAFSGSGSWVLQDGTFSFLDLVDMFQEADVQRLLRAYENRVTVHVHCSAQGEWTSDSINKEAFAKRAHVAINPDDKGSPEPGVSNFVKFLAQFLKPQPLGEILEPSDVVGSIRFSRPTLYVFPGGQGDSALFGVNGFNMLVDGGFGRRACFWDFVRHLDRVDALLITRINNCNVSGVGSLLRRKTMSDVYPQIGHVFCNLSDKKHSPDGQKDQDNLVIDMETENQTIVDNLKQLNVKPQACFRDPNVEPINLYHKVGRGKLDMYVVNPSRDSREVKEFLHQWNAQSHYKTGLKFGDRELTIPLPNLMSICALLVWQPTDPTDSITRILFPGSSPQAKIFEGLGKLKHLDVLKQPICTERSMQASRFKRHRGPRKHAGPLRPLSVTRAEERIETKASPTRTPREERKVEPRVAKKNDEAKEEKKEEKRTELKTKPEEKKEIKKKEEKKMDSKRPVAALQRKPEVPKANVPSKTPPAKIEVTKTPIKAKGLKDATNKKTVEAKNIATKAATAAAAKKEALKKKPPPSPIKGKQSIKTGKKSISPASSVKSVDKDEKGPSSPALSVASVEPDEKKDKVILISGAAEEGIETDLQVAHDSAEEEKTSVDEKQSLEEETRAEKEGLLEMAVEEEEEEDNKLTQGEDELTTILKEVPEKLSQESQEPEDSLEDNKIPFPTEEEVEKDLDEEFIMHKDEDEVRISESTKADTVHEETLVELTDEEKETKAQPVPDTKQDIPSESDAEHLKDNDVKQEPPVTKSVSPAPQAKEEAHEIEKEEEKPPPKISNAVEDFGADIREALRKTRELMMGGMKLPDPPTASSNISAVDIKAADDKVAEIVTDEPSKSEEKSDLGAKEETFGKIASEIKDVLSGEKQDVKDNVKAETETITRETAEAIEEFTEMLSEEKQDMKENVTAETETIATETANEIKDIKDVLSEEKQNMKDSVEAETETITREASEAIEEFTEMLSEKKQDMKENVKAETETIATEPADEIKDIKVVEETQDTDENIKAEIETIAKETADEIEDIKDVSSEEKQDMTENVKAETETTEAIKEIEEVLSEEKQDIKENDKADIETIARETAEDIKEIKEEIPELKEEIQDIKQVTEEEADHKEEINNLKKKEEEQSDLDEEGLEDNIEEVGKSETNKQENVKPEDAVEVELKTKIEDTHGNAEESTTLIGEQKKEHILHLDDQSKADLNPVVEELVSSVVASAKEIVDEVKSKQEKEAATQSVSVAPEEINLEEKEVHNETDVVTTNLVIEPENEDNKTVDVHSPLLHKDEKYDDEKENIQHEEKEKVVEETEKNTAKVAEKVTFKEDTDDKDTFMVSKVEKPLEKEGSYSAADTLPMSEEAVPEVTKEPTAKQSETDDEQKIEQNRVQEDKQLAEGLEKHVLEKAEKLAEAATAPVVEATKEKTAPLQEQPAKFVIHHEYPKTPDEVADLPIDEEGAPTTIHASSEEEEEEELEIEEDDERHDDYDNDVLAHEEQEQCIMHNVMAQSEVIPEEGEDEDEEEEGGDIAQESAREPAIFSTLSADRAEVVTLSDGTSPSTPLSPKSPKDHTDKIYEIEALAQQSQDAVDNQTKDSAPAGSGEIMISTPVKDMSNVDQTMDLEEADDREKDRDECLTKEPTALYDNTTTADDEELDDVEEKDTSTEKEDTKDTEASIRPKLQVNGVSQDEHEDYYKLEDDVDTKDEAEDEEKSCPEDNIEDTDLSKSKTEKHETEIQSKGESTSKPSEECVVPPAMFQDLEDKTSDKDVPSSAHFTIGQKSDGEEEDDSFQPQQRHTTIDPMTQSFCGEESVFSEEVDSTAGMAVYEKSPVGSPQKSGDEMEFSEELHDRVPDVSSTIHGKPRDDIHRVTSLSELERRPHELDHDDMNTTRHSFSDDYTPREKSRESMSQSYYEETPKKENIYQTVDGTTQRMDQVGTDCTSPCKEDKTLIESVLKTTGSKDIKTVGNESIFEQEHSNETILASGPPTSSTKQDHPEAKAQGQADKITLPPDVESMSVGLEMDEDIVTSTPKMSGSPQLEEEYEGCCEVHVSDPSSLDFQKEGQRLSQDIDSIFHAGEKGLEEILYESDVATSGILSRTREIKATPGSDVTPPSLSDAMTRGDDSRQQTEDKVAAKVEVNGNTFKADATSKLPQFETKDDHATQQSNMTASLYADNTNNVPLNFGISSQPPTDNSDPDAQNANSKNQHNNSSEELIKRDTESESLTHKHSEDLIVGGQKDKNGHSEFMHVSEKEHLDESSQMTSAKRAAGYQQLCGESGKGNGEWERHNDSEDDDDDDQDGASSIKSGHSGREFVEGDLRIHPGPSSKRELSDEEDDDDADDVDDDRYHTGSAQHIYDVENGGRNGAKPLVAHGGGQATHWEEEEGRGHHLQTWVIPEEQDLGSSPRHLEEDHHLIGEKDLEGLASQVDEGFDNKEWTHDQHHEFIEQPQQQQRGGEHGSESSGGSSPHGFEMDSPEVRHTSFEFPRPTFEERYLPDLKRHAATPSSAGSTQLSTPSSESGIVKDEKNKTPIDDWGEPMGLPSPPPPPTEDVDTKSPPLPPQPASPATPNGKVSLDRKRPMGRPNATTRNSSVGGDNRRDKTSDRKPSSLTASPKKTPPTKNGTQRRSESPRPLADGKKGAATGRTPYGSRYLPTTHFYVDLAYVPHHGNARYSNVEFFKRVRARYYVFSGINPSKEVFNSLLEAKQTWEDKDLQVTLIPTYDTDTLGYWVTLNEEMLTKHNIDLAPSASRCTINLQDHETSCAAYRLEF